MREAIVNLLPEGLELDNGEVGIDARKRAERQLLHVVDRPAGLDDNGACIQRKILLDRPVVVQRPLREGDKVHGVVLPVDGRVHGVLDHTDDLVSTVLTGVR